MELSLSIVGALSVSNAHGRNLEEISCTIFALIWQGCWYLGLNGENEFGRTWNILCLATTVLNKDEPTEDTVKGPCAWSGHSFLIVGMIDYSVGQVRPHGTVCLLSQIVCMLTVVFMGFKALYSSIKSRHSNLALNRGIGSIRSRCVQKGINSLRTDESIDGQLLMKLVRWSLVEGTWFSQNPKVPKPQNPKQMKRVVKY